MSFIWNALDYVPVVGTAKNGVEAVVALSMGDFKGAAAQATKAAIGGVLDTCTFGTGSAIGKVVITGTAKTAANVGARAVAKEVLPKSRMTYFDIALITRKPDDPKGEEKGPSGRGEHVINNNVLRVYRDIVDQFVNRAMGENLQEMIISGRLSSNSRLLNAINQPLPQSIMTLIQDELKVYIRESYTDYNSESYGRQIEILRGAVVSYMQRIYEHLQHGGESGGTGGIPAHERNVRDVIEAFIAGDYFVDEFAKLKWLKKPGNSGGTFERAHKAVVKMFRRLIYDDGNDEVIQWVRELIKAKRRK